MFHISLGNNHSNQGLILRYEDGNKDSEGFSSQNTSVHRSSLTHSSHCAYSPLCLLSRALMRPLWGGCDREAACEMVHYGWACAASWQMLRHASETGGEPAGGGRGRRDAATAAYAASINTRGKSSQAMANKKKKKTPLLQCAIKMVRFMGLHVHCTPTSGGLDSSYCCCFIVRLFMRQSNAAQPSASSACSSPLRQTQDTPQTSVPRSLNPNLRRCVDGGCRPASHGHEPTTFPISLSPSSSWYHLARPQ